MNNMDDLIKTAFVVLVVAMTCVLLAGAGLSIWSMFLKEREGDRSQTTNLPAQPPQNSKTIEVEMTPDEFRNLIDRQGKPGIPVQSPQSPDKGYL